MILKGIDQLKKYDSYLKNKQLGLITSISGVDRNLISTIQILHENYNLKALYAPEHGVRGDIEAGKLVDTYIDQETGVVVYSLYRKKSKHFTKEMLEGIDAIVYDIQDLGIRYYTFISTLINTLRDCEKYQKELIVLDRPNPLGGEVVEGSMLEPSYSSFVGIYPIATRYGLTIGELAVMVKEEQSIKCKLTIIPCEGWKREKQFHNEKQIWIMPSPSIPRYETILAYIGTCLVEGTNLSEGRGTSCPFEIIGAPYIQANKLTRYLREKKLEGIAFTPAYFTPTSSKYNGDFCEGIHLHITDYEKFESYKTALTILEGIRDLYATDFKLLEPPKQGNRYFISLLNGNAMLEQKSWTTEAILEANNNQLVKFKKRKEKYHIYE